MAIKFNKREAANRMALACLVALLALEAASDHVLAFPSLFSVRAHSLFKRQQQQQQPQLQQQQPLKSHQPDQLVPLTSSHVPVVRGAAGLPNGDQQLAFAASQLLPAELMRLSNMQRPQQIAAHQSHQTLLSSAASHPQQQRHYIYADNDGRFGTAAQDGAFFKLNEAPSMTASAMAQQQQQQRRPLVASDPSSFDLGDHTNYFADSQSPAVHNLGSDNRQQLTQSASSGPGRATAAASQQLHLEPTHTSEIVDKIEQHIGQQVEYNLNHHGHHAGQQQHQQTAASGYHQPDEKEAAQSEEQEESSAEEPAGGEEKQHEEQHKGHAESHKHQQHHHEEHDHQQHHHQHHEEHPPEAFEVHHKKGGKSFQYFHQGHQHHA
jgi:hypothetical protein